MTSVKINRKVTATVTFMASGDLYDPKHPRLAIKNPRGNETAGVLQRVSAGVWRGQFKVNMIGIWKVKAVSAADGEEAETDSQTFAVVGDGF